MKGRNMKVGLHVVVKDCAFGYAGDHKGSVHRLIKDSEWCFYIDAYNEDKQGNPMVFSHEVRKATPEEIAAYEQGKKS